MKMVWLIWATILKYSKMARPQSNVRKHVMHMFYANFGPSTREVADATSRPGEPT